MHLTRGHLRLHVLWSTIALTTGQLALHCTTLGCMVVALITSQVLCLKRLHGGVHLCSRLSRYNKHLILNTLGPGYTLPWHICTALLAG